jgi:subtilase family serine protease
MHMLASAGTPNLLDVTVNYCENRVTAAELALSEWLLAAFSVSGTTIAAAAGDKGSSGCYPTKGPAVTYPASSAFAVAIGGASYRGSAEAPDDLAVWSDIGSAGGGGGVSRAIKAPPWQGGGERRVPDISTYSVPGGVGSIPVCTGPTDCVWTAVGGTSLSATVLGATGAMLEQVSGIHGVARRWGDIAAALWRGREEPSAIIDIVDGSNQTFNGVCCRAKAGYDTASGWGLLVPDSLSRVVPAHAG